MRTCIIPEQQKKEKKLDINFCFLSIIITVLLYTGLNFMNIL